MKRWMMACAFVAGLGAAGGVPGGADEGHRRHQGHPPDAAAAAIGRPGNPGEVTRTIDVEMSDAMRFRPRRIRVRQGETIRFVVTNVGRLEHEMVLGSIKELKEHAASMRESPGMKHDEPNAVSVPPGGSGELVWRFTREGPVPFACLEPGHFEAGMIGEIVVDR